MDRAPLDSCVVGAMGEGEPGQPDVDSVDTPFLRGDGHVRRLPEIEAETIRRAYLRTCRQ